VGSGIRRAGLALAAAGWLLAASPAGAQQRPDAFLREPDRQAQDAVRKQLGARYRLLVTDHYRVFSDTSPRYHRVVAGVLEQFHQLVRPRFFERDIEPVDFYLIEQAVDYERFTKQRGFERASSFGFYDPEKRVLYARRYFPDGSESGVGTLFHEAVHAMIDAEFGRGKAPVWFHEGFASLFEVGRVLLGAWVYGNPNPWRETDFRTAFEAGRVPQLADFLRLTESSFRGDGQREMIYYNAGRSLFLSVLRTQGEIALRRFIQELRQGVSGELALEHATGLPLARVQTQWHRSIREVNFGGDYQNRGTGKDALEILSLGARKFPRDGNLRLALATLQIAAGDREHAIENARAALEDPRCIRPQLALSVIAHAILPANGPEAARALMEALRYQPWNEVVMKQDYELLAWMFGQIGDLARANAMRQELAALEALDGPSRR
jgi:hypothetical protein